MPLADQLSRRSPNRPANPSEREMRMEPVLDDHASLSKYGAQVGLEATQQRQIRAGQTRPEHLGTTNARKRANALRLELEAALLSNHWREIKLQCRDGIHREMAQEMQRQVDALDVIETNPLAKRLQIIDGCLQPGPQRVRKIDREEDAPALGFSLRRGCPPLSPACHPAAAPPRGRRQTS